MGIMLKKFLIIATAISLITFLISGVMTYVNLGEGQGFIMAWLNAFAHAVVLMVPSGFVLMLFTGKLVELLAPDLPVLAKRLLVGLLMAISMESLIAVSNTLTNVGFQDIQSFLLTWAGSFITALPIGFVISLFMTFIVKPRIDALVASKSSTNSNQSLAANGSV